MRGSPVRASIPVLLLCSSLCVCGKADVGVVPSGSWAQALPPGDLDVAELQVDASGAATARFGVDTASDPNQSINYCATATLPRLTLDADGRFDVSGSLIGRGTGLTDGPPVPAAQFTGTVKSSTMELTVTNANGVWGRFTLTLGAPLKGERVCVD
jgi:hypothetical protein